ncbi:MAG: TIGR03086 family metal-binding protein [Actinomycetota bacterium]
MTNNTPTSPTEGIDFATDSPVSADPRQSLLRALDIMGGIVDQVQPDQLAGPTPCAEFDTSALLGHIVGVARRVSALGRGEDGNAVSLEVTDVAPDAWSGAWATEAGRIEDAWANDTVLQKMMALPFAELPGGAAASLYAAEFTVHGWDLATAIGAEVTWSDQIATDALAVVQFGIPAEGRGTVVPFDPVVALPADAAPIELLVAWVGRNPRP